MIARRRALSAALVAVLVGIVAGPVLLAAPAAADGGLELTTPIDGVTWSSGGTALISGMTNDTGNVITVTDEGGTPTGCDTTTIDGFGNWACASATPLTDWEPGHHTLTATQGSKTDIVEFDIRPPAPVVDQSYVNAGEGGTLHFTGTTTYDDADIVIDLPGGPYCVGGSSYATSGTSWLCDLGGWSGTGHYTATVRQVVNGVSSNGVSLDAYVVSPGVTITTPSGSPPTVEWWYGNVLDIAGTAADSSMTVDVLVPGETGCTDLPVDPVTLQWGCNTWYPDAGNGVVITAMQSPTVYDDLAINVLVMRPDLDVPSTLPTEVHSFGTFALYYAEGTVHIRIQGHPALFCDADVFSSPVLYMDTCEIDLSSLTPGDPYVVEWWQDTETGDGTHATQSFTAANPAAPPASCTFTPGGASITAPSGFDLWVSGPIRQGGSEPMFPEAPGDCGGLAGTLVTEVDSWGPDLCNNSCNLSGLAPGVYDVLYEDASNSYDWFFTVPERPVVEHVVRGADIELSGTANPDHDVFVTTGGSTRCTTTADAGGSWSCTFPDQGDPKVWAAQVDPDSGGISPRSATVTLAVPPTAPTVPKTANRTPPSWLLDFGLLGETVAPGDTITVGSSGLPAGSAVSVELHSVVVQLLDIVTDDSTSSFAFTIPLDAELGAHTLAFSATTPEGDVVSVEHPITIVAAPVEPEEPVVDPVSDGDDSSGSGSGSGSGVRNEPAAPNALSNALPTLARVFEDPWVLVTAAGLGLALLFLVAIPTELLNSTLSSNHHRLGRGFRKVEGAFTRAQEWFVRVTRSRALAAAIVVTVVAVIFGFVDPNFGFDLSSLRLVLSLGIAFFLLSYVASWATGAILRRTEGVESEIVIQPAIILFAVVGVVVARLLDFAPGFLIGLVIGLELVRAGRKAAANAVLVQFGIILAIALAAWFGYSMFAAELSPDDFWGALTRDTLAALVAEGLMAIFVAAFPLRFLEGRDLWEQSKPLWFGTFFVIASAFALLVLPTALVGTSGSDVGAWILVFAAFGLLVLALWAVFTWLDRRDAKAEEAEGAEERNTPQHEDSRR